MALDSKHVFEARLLALNLADLLPALRREGWDTLGNFAFACNFTPGGDDQVFVQGVLTPILGQQPTPRAAAVRRLFVEAYTAATYDLKTKHERTSEDVPRRLPLVERAARLEALNNRLNPALHVSGDLEPSYALVDLAAHMADEGILRYVPWEDRGKRESEVIGRKKDVSLRLDASGLVRT
jgi:hypothetical protein